VSNSIASAFDGITVSQDELPTGYAYRVTRYADVILRDAFPEHWRDLIEALRDFWIDFDAEIAVGGGSRTSIAARFDGALNARGWDKQNMEIDTRINTQAVAHVRGHEIDMYKLGPGGRFPGIACEMEWNNKDPFFDRDLSNFYALHRAGAVAVGVIVTRGPRLQTELKAWEAGVRARRKAEGKKKPSYKYITSTTNWPKLMARVDIGGGGECPLFLVGIEPDRVHGLGGAPKDYAAAATEEEPEEDAG